jgi:RNA polymerase sigma-70 factor (ECF subfamily)
LYEEKTSSQVAAQLGLNENATRQLVFRAKAAFKKALVGEAETRGLTMSEIISVAARKASKDAGKYVSVASALLLVLAVSIGVLPNLATSPVQLNANSPLVATDLEASSESNVADSSASNSSTEAEQADASSSASLPAQADASSAASLPAQAEQLASSQPDNTGVDIDAGTSKTESAASASSAQLASFANSLVSIDQSPFDPWLLDPLFGQESIETNLLSGSAVADSNGPALLSIVSNQGLWADLQLQTSSAVPFQAVTIGLYIDGKQYFASTNQQDLIVLAEDNRTETYVYVGAIGLLTDLSGVRYDNTRLDGGKVQISVTFDTQTRVVTSTRLDLAERI